MLQTAAGVDVHERRAINCMGRICRSASKRSWSLRRSPLSRGTTIRVVLAELWTSFDGCVIVACLRVMSPDVLSVVSVTDKDVSTWARERRTLEGQNVSPNFLLIRHRKLVCLCVCVCVCVCVRACVCHVPRSEACFLAARLDSVSL